MVCGGCGHTAGVAAYKGWRRGEAMGIRARGVGEWEGGRKGLRPGFIWDGWMEGSEMGDMTDLCLGE